RVTATVDPTDQVWQMLGLKTMPVTPEYVTSTAPTLRGGLYIQAVSPNSLGAQAKILKGDILVGVKVGERNWETIRPDNILFILRQPEVSQTPLLQFFVVRRNKLHDLPMSLAAESSLHNTISR
ncbi:trypsin-like peptidase domain-containing protein, partial [Singulisphaera rosea]